jgi:hypothetical protein
MYLLKLVSIDVVVMVLVCEFAYNKQQEVIENPIIIK